MTTEKFEIGKRYKTLAGAVTSPLEARTNYWGKFCGFTATVEGKPRTWTERGRWYDAVKCGYDLLPGDIEI